MKPGTRRPIDRTTQTVRSADGRLLCFAEWGDPVGLPVFSLHGTPGCRLLSARKAQYGLEDLVGSLGIRLITYDRPGYGQSERQPKRSVADTARDVAAIADELGLDLFAVEGGSSGSAHALAAAVLLGQRVRRVACVAPMASYAELGPDEWSKDQDPAVVEYIAWCLEGEGRLTIEFAREDAQIRAASDQGDPNQRADFEQTRNGIWGWVDDELAVLKPWGFNPGLFSGPAAIWYDPDENVLPRQHSEWLARKLPDAALVTTSALGHRAKGDPQPDWHRLYSWLIAS